MQLYQSVKVFTGQGAEKYNDVPRSVVLRKSNKKNPASYVLQLEFRRWELRDSERTKGHTAKKIHITGKLKLRTKVERIPDCCYMSIFK
jgi:hypothetical protein